MLDRRDKGQEYFDRGLKNTIDSFEKAREWADLSNCLQKVKKQIDTYSGLPIPRQRDLAKRLAQCLNPEINVIHQLTLEVYTEVFKREIELMHLDQEKGIGIYERKSSIALFFSGLFNFYQFAAFEVKQNFLDIISTYLLQMKQQLILSLPGFMLCMLPALEDQNGEVLKKVEAILMETEKIVGTSEFYGEIWKAMLRTPRSRLSAIKYLDKRIPKTIKQAKDQRDKGSIYVSDFTITIVNSNVSLTKDQYKLARENEMRQRLDLHDFLFFYYPNKSKLVINALMSGLSIHEPQVYVNRGTLDFLISHMPIKSDINSIQENIKLVGCATLAYTKKDFATLNKISTWLFEHLDEDDYEEIDINDPTIVTIVESQKNLYQNSMDVKKGIEAQIRKYGGNKDQLNHIDKSINNPIQILLRIMSDEQNTTEPILQRLSIDLIKFIRFHWVNRFQDRRFMDSVKNLLEQISPQYKAVLQSLSLKLQKEIENLDYMSKDTDKQNLESIELISFAICDLQKSYDKLLVDKSSKEQMISILSNLLGGMNKISSEGQNLELVLPSLAVVEQILSILNRLDDQGKTLNNQKNDERFREAIDKFNDLYVVMSKKLQQQGSENKQELDTYKKYNDIMGKLLYYQNIDASTNEMPEWLKMLIECSKTKLTKICLVSSNLFQFILKHESQQLGAGVVMHIQRLIADGGQPSKLQEIIQKNDYKTFREEFLQFLQQDELDDRGDSYPSHCKDIIKNLWSLLDLEEDTENIVHLLQIFDVQVPRIFSDVVIENLTKKRDSDGQDVNQAIKRFTIFWKFTGTSTVYTNYTPFKTEVNEKMYLALHNMINFLEDTDPTLRLSCRSWLSQSKQYMRILDPIIEEFIKNSNFKIQDKQVVIDGKIENQYVIENFGKLRNIILNTQDEIIQYMKSRVCTQHIMKLFQDKFMNPETFAQLQQMQQINSFSRQASSVRGSTAGGDYAHQMLFDQKLYLDMLVEITLKFIRAEQPQKKEAFGDKLNQSDTLTVNASACEFMELILKQIEKYPKNSNKIAHMIIVPLIDTFQNVIYNKNYAMQVNIINLLDLILNNCNFQGTINDGREQPIEDQRHKCADILKSQVLIDSIIMGLKCEVSFVRSKFIKFVEMFVPYIRKFTKENDFFKDEFKNHIEKLIDCFCGLLKKADITQFSTTRIKLNQIGNQAPRPIGNRISSVQPTQQQEQRMNQRPGKQEKDHLLEKLKINQETDIVLIIEGLQCIINTCLALDFHSDGFTESESSNNDEQLDEEEKERLEKMKKSQKDKKSGFFTGLFQGGENNYFAPDTFGAVKQLIYDKIQFVFISCIYCWNYQELLNWNDYHFTRSGMFPYTQEDNNRIRDKLRVRSQTGLITFEDNLQNNSNAIQKKIIQLLRPIAKKQPDQFIEGALNVWLRKSLLEQDDKNIINRSYEKLIQMLVCVYEAQRNQKSGRIEYTLPPDQVIHSVIKYIMEASAKKQIKDPLVHSQRWTKNNPPLKPNETTSETLLNFFMYSYLAYNPTMFDPLIDESGDEKQKVYQKVYNNLLRYFNAFKLSRNPFSVCWLLEILNIVTIKFGFTESKLDQRQKKEYHDLFNNMLTNCGSIISDTFNITFHEDQTFRLAFPPTVYELLWRYEYISFKHLINESQDRFSDDKLSFDRQIEQDRQTGNSSQMIDTMGPVFFEKYHLRKMSDNKFEYYYRGSEDIDQNIFRNMEILIKHRSMLSDEYIKQSDFMEVIKHAIHLHENHPDRMLQQTKFFIIITLKQILCQLLVNLVGQGDTEKTNKSMQIIFNTTIQIMQNDNKQIQVAKQSKKQQFDEVMNEFITEFFASIVERSHQIEPDLIKPYRREIIDLFNQDSFFQTSMLNLKQWQKIMNKFIDGKPDEIFEEQMTKWSFNGGLFDNNKTIIAQKCYAMKRIAFLIFSCDTDDFQGQLDQLMKKMIEVFKQKQKAEIKQRLFLFFLTRVMLIRLNFQTLTEALRKLWPHLLNELISVFEIKVDMDKENSDLTIEAIKLVELLSSLNIEDFQMNQWIFLIDGYGMKLENHKMPNKSQSSGDISARNKTIKDTLQGKGAMTEDQASEVFKTFIVRFMGKQEYSFYNVERPQDGRNQNELSQEYLASLDIDEGKRNIVAKGNSLISPESVGSGSARGDARSSNQPQAQIPGSRGIKQLDLSIINQGIKPQPFMTPNVSGNNQFMVANGGEFDTRLQDHAYELQKSINQSNVEGNEFNRQEAEAKIESDFLKNDEMIKL